MLSLLVPHMFLNLLIPAPMAIRAPNPHRMNLLAIDTLDEARSLAYSAPIKATPAVRLALAWLALNKIAQDWQIEKYWEALTKAPGHGMDEYVRDRDMRIYVNRWRIVAGERRD